MKGYISRIAGFAVAAVMISGMAMAAENATLTRAQWLKKIGPCATSYDTLKETLASIAPEDRVEFTQRALKAVSRMPVSGEEKGAAFVRTAVGCISGKLGDQKKNVIAEVFADVPVEYLPVVTEQLAKRFDQELNHLSDDQYDKIAQETLEVAMKRNAKTDEPSVRNTFVILAFLRGTKNQKLKDHLISMLPDERMRNLAAAWVPPAVEKQDYSGLTSAANVEEESVTPQAIYNAIGHTTLDRLLANLNENQNLKDSEMPSSDSGSDKTEPSLSMPLSSVGFGTTSFNINSPYEYSPTDVALNRVPEGYQNQRLTVYQRHHRGAKAQGNSTVNNNCCALSWSQMIGW